MKLFIFLAQYLLLYRGLQLCPNTVIIFRSIYLINFIKWCIFSCCCSEWHWTWNLIPVLFQGSSLRHYLFYPNLLVDLRFIIGYWLYSYMHWGPLSSSTGHCLYSFNWVVMWLILVTTLLCLSEGKFHFIAHKTCIRHNLDKDFLSLTHSFLLS